MAKEPKTDRGHLVQGLLDKYPDAGKRTLAKLLHEAGHAETLEKARSMVRYYAGARGEKLRNGRGIAKEDAKLGEAGKPVGTLPPGVRQTIETVNYNDPHKWLVLSDLHVPYHDETAIEAAVKTGVEEGCDAVLINGDGIDFYGLSRFVKDPRFRSAKAELDTFKLVTKYIGESFATKAYKLGNHCDRWNTFIWQNAPQFADIPEVSFASVSGLESDGWEMIDSFQHYTLGGLNIFHGHELPRGLTDPVNVARGVWLRVRESALVGHWHKPSTHLESGGITKRITTCYSTGCLCDLRPAYASVNSWVQGFAIVTVGKDGDWNVSNRTVDRGQVYRTE